MKFEVKKLVRDKVADIVAEQGRKPMSRQLENEEFISELKKKLAEETAELPGTKPEDILDELADIQEVLNVLLSVLGISREDLDRARETKNNKVGDFDKRIFLETVELDPDSKWVSYYREKGFRELKD